MSKQGDFVFASGATLNNAAVTLNRLNFLLS